MAGKPIRCPTRIAAQKRSKCGTNTTSTLDEPRRSGRATKGQHTKNQEDDPPKKKKGKKGSKAAASEAEENGDDDAIVRCICGDTEDYRGWMMIVCDQCDAWQHNFCMGVTEDEAKLPEEYYCEQCKPENHKELIAAMKRGEKPWEEKIRRREEEESQKKKKGSRKSKGGRASGISDHQEPTPRGSATPSVQPETASKRKAQEAPLTVVAAGQHASPASSHPPASATSPTGGARRKSIFDATTLKRRQSTVDEIAAKRRKSSAPAGRRDSTVAEMVDSIHKLPEERRKGAEALRNILKNQIDTSVKQQSYRVPDGQTPTVVAGDLSLRIEYALYQHYPTEEDKSAYTEQFRTILFNTKKNKSLVDRLLNESLKPEELAQMSSDDMASEELQREREKIKEEADKQSVLVQEVGPRYKKTHKGEELVGDISGFDGTRSQEEITYTAPPPQISPTFGDGSPDATNGDSKEPLALNTTSHDRRGSTNFDIQQIFSNVRSPEVAQGGFSQPPAPADSQGVGSVPKRSPGEDADIDRLLKDDEAMDTSPEVSDPTVWHGNITMLGQGGGSFDAIGRYAGGADMSHLMPYNDLLPAKLEISGRIVVQRADKYVTDHQVSRSTQVCLLQLVPLNGLNDPGMASIFNYLQSKERWGCIKNPDLHKDIKDVYVVLVDAGMGPLPNFMQQLEDLNIDSPRLYNGLYVVFMIKTQASPPREFDGAMEVENRAPSTSDGPDATPIVPTGPTPTYPTAGGGKKISKRIRLIKRTKCILDNAYNPTDLQREILGPYVNCTTVKQLITGAPNLNETQLSNLRHILERDPAAREDLQELSRHLQARSKKDSEENSGVS